MGRGSRPKVRWASDRQRKKKEREKAKNAPPATGGRTRKASAKPS